MSAAAETLDAPGKSFSVVSRKSDVMGMDLEAQRQTRCALLTTIAKGV